jgi:phosphotriesterase-related protein
MKETNNFNRRQFLTTGAMAFAGVLGGSAVTKSFGNALLQGKKVNLVPTLKGDVDCNKLGVTLMHEHLLTWSTTANVFQWDIPENLRSKSVEIAVKLLHDSETAGLKTFVDMLPLAQNYIELYREIAGRTNVNIIVSTGYYAEEKTPESLRNFSELQMEELMHREVTEGFKGTNIRAGIIKVASNNVPLTPWEQRVYRAAARVQKATGVPIGCHAWKGAREQLDILMQQGANPNRINFAHIETEPGWEGRTIEQTSERLLTIVKDGGYLLFNNFFQEFYTPWKDLVYLLHYFCDKGFANRIFTSIDTNWQWKDGKQVFEEEDGQDPAGAGKRTYAYLLSNGIPLMEKAGFSKDEIDTFLVKNPRNFFSTND